MYMGVASGAHDGSAAYVYRGYLRSGRACTGSRGQRRRRWITRVHIDLAAVSSEKKRIKII